MSTNIYILRLEGGKYYVGKSSDPEKRYRQHLAGKGSSWTKKHKPISIEKIISATSAFDEDKTTKEYMSKYGIENVRGGSYTQVDLDDAQVDTLNMEIWGAKDACLLCGRRGHYAKECYATYGSNHDRIAEVECFKCGEIGHYASECGMNTYRIVTCYKCGVRGHYANECFLGGKY